MNDSERRVFEGLDKVPRVLTGLSAFCYCGMSLYGHYYPQILTPNKEIDGFRFGSLISYHYTPQYDITYEVTPLTEFPHILVPSKERAIVEIIRNGINKSIDEGAFCDALYDYINSPFYNEEGLKRAAKYFNVPWEDVVYWLKEGADYSDVVRPD